MIRKVMLLGMILFAGSAAFAQPRRPPTLNFDDLMKFDPVKQIFRIQGYVLDVYKCPPCPPGAMCKPCLPNNVTLVDSPDRSDLSKLKRLRIYTDEIGRFKVTGKYLVTVKVKGNLGAGKQVESADLVSVDRLPPH